MTREHDKELHYYYSLLLFIIIIFYTMGEVHEIKKTNRCITRQKKEEKKVNYYIYTLC